MSKAAIFETYLNGAWSPSERARRLGVMEGWVAEYRSSGHFQAMSPKKQRKLTRQAVQVARIK